MRGGQKQASKSSLSMRMTSSLKEQTSFDKTNPPQANKFKARNPDNFPNFENKRNTPYFNQISFEKSNKQKNNFEDEKKQKNLLMDLISAERNRKLGNSLSSGKMLGNSGGTNDMKPKFVEIAVPKNTMTETKREGAEHSSTNYETKLYESNNTCNFHLSTSQNKADRVREETPPDKPKRETDLMEIDFELDTGHFHEEERQTSEEGLSVKSESQSIEVEPTSPGKRDAPTRPGPDEKAESDAQVHLQRKTPKFKIPAKSDGNATVGQRSFVTSSRTDQRPSKGSRTTNT